MSRSVAHLLIFMRPEDGNDGAASGVIPIRRKENGRSFMVTNYPQQLTATAARHARDERKASWPGRWGVSASCSAGFAATTRCCTSRAIA